MKPLIIHEQAESEIAEAAKYYENRVSNLGFDFVAEIEAAFAAIQVAPTLWPKRKHGTRRYLLHRFPHAVVYADLADRVWIVAVAHGSRRPYYWKHRLKQTG